MSYTREYAARASRLSITSSALDALERLASASDGSVWWHDLPYPGRDQLIIKGYCEGDGTPCNSHGNDHPGYVRLTDAGRKAWRESIGQ